MAMDKLAKARFTWPFYRNSTNKLRMSQCLYEVRKEQIHNIYYVY